MARIVWRIVIVLSISLNLAFLGSMLFSTNTVEEQRAPLNLSEKQKQEVAKIQLTIHRKNELIKGKIVACQKDLLAAISQEHTDRSKINKCIEDISVMQREIQMNAVDQILQIRQHLDKDQCDCLMKELAADMGKKNQPCDKDCCQVKKN
jgi:hypothetical protein